MRSRIPHRCKLAIIGLLFGFVYQVAIAGEASTPITPQSNLDVMQNLAGMITKEIIDSCHISQGDSIVVRFGPGEDIWIVQYPMIAALRAYGCKVFSENDSTSSNRIIIGNSGVESRVQYTGIFRDGLLGTKKMKRSISTRFSCTAVKKATDEFFFSGLFVKQSVDTVKVDDVPELETASAKSTRGELPSDGFLDRVVEPFVIMGAAGVAIYLFFHVRG